MCSIMNDFIKTRNNSDGHGFFEGKASAVTFSRNLTKRHELRFTRYGKIPPSFIDFLIKEYGFVPPDSSPGKSDPISSILDFLRGGHCMTQAGQSEIDLMVSQIYKNDLRIPKNIYKIDASHIWEKIDLFRRNKGPIRRNLACEKGDMQNNKI